MRRAVLLCFALAGCTERAGVDAAIPTPPKTAAAAIKLLDASAGAPAATTTATPAATSTTSGGRTMSGPIDLARAMEERRALLQTWIKNGAGDPENGWAMAHGLLAFGPELRTTDGRLAIDVLASYAKVENKRVTFPPKSPQGVVLAAHKDLIIKKMIDGGVPLDRRFDVPGLGKVTLKKMVQDARSQLKIPTTDEEWHDFAWSFLAQIASQPPGAKKDPLLVDAAIATMGYVEQQQSFLDQLMKEGRPEKVEKRKQLIYSHTCGGLHLIDAAIAGAAYAGTPELIDRARHQLDILHFRWVAERRIYRDSIAKAPEYQIFIRVQELKFYGHLLEVFSRARRLGIIGRDSQMIAKVAPIAVDLLRSIEVLSDAYAKLARIRQEREQTYLDLIGDGCHAVHGLREALVAFFAP